ncbi:hypothetical protein ACFL37_02020 [Candidatus Margulisiibacteriota bacterium]
MTYLLVSGIVSLLFGALFLLSPALLGSLGQALNRVIMFLDQKLESLKLWIGLLLLAVGAWLLYVVANYAELAYLTPVWIVCLAFGLLFLFFPQWLAWLSNVSNRVVFSTDDVVMGSRKIFGIILLIFSIYIFYGLFLLG